MAETTNYNLTKPAAGASGWAPDINTNMDVIDAQMKTNNNGVVNHTNSGTNKHKADQIQTDDASNVEAKLAALAAGKADAGHTHSIYALATEMEAVEGTLSLLAPNLNEETLNVSVQNRNGGLRISFGFSTNIFWNNAQITVENADEEQLVTMVTGSSIAYIDGSDLTGVVEDDVLTVTVVVNSGFSSRTRVVSHTFKDTDNNIQNRLDALETTMTIANLIDSITQDSNALQAIANYVQSSNTLAQKVAELMIAAAAAAAQ